MKHLIIGGDSKVGQALFPLLTQTSGQSVIYTTRREEDKGPQSSGIKTLHMDLLNPHFPNGGIDVVYLLAAITKVVDCEANPSQAWRTNADAPVTLAFAAKMRGAHVVFMSSDAVERAPHLIYSKTKAYVEGVLLGIGASILRPAAIGTPENYKLVAQVLARLGRDQTPGILRWSPP